VVPPPFPLCCCSYPFEIHDDALVLRKMLEYDNMQKLGGEAKRRAARGEGGGNVV
jgi:hypothetical protein